MRCSCSMLFVEDSYLLAQSAVQALGDAGLKVQSVPDARSALELFRHHRFDCAVIDVELPGGMDGVELARRILELDPDFPIALATGYDATRCGAPADVPVFQKPYRFEDLTASVCPRVLARR
jgi:CheY-like chemotaxis protein